MSDKIIRLRKGRRGELKPNHPWIYKGQFLSVNPSIKPGDIVSVLDAENKFIGRGYRNPRSEISIRLLTHHDEPITKEFFNNRIRLAAEKRKDIAATNAVRMIFSEGDNLPGLIADIYSDTVVFQILTLGMEKLKPLLIEGLKEILNPKYIYEKSDSMYRKAEGLEAVKKWWGAKGATNIEIFEGKARFIVDIANGHKTGFYLDQRQSRLAMDGISKGRKVLDLFCYTGAFSSSALVCGAADSVGVDIKREWLDLAHKNAVLNGVSDRVKFIEDDAFSALRKIYNSGQTFDIIVVDPPSFMRSKRTVVNASKGYKELNLMAMKTLSDKGVLATFSCSHSMPNETFSGVLKNASRDAKKRFKVLKRCHQPKDHPIIKAIPETEYLKGYFLEVTAE